MGAKEMLETVQRLKEDCIFNNDFHKTPETEQFFNDNWMQILDILDDVLYFYVNQNFDMLVRFLDVDLKSIKSK